MMEMESPDDTVFVMVSYLPTPSKIGEMKTKPTQTAARTLNGVGVQADIIIARSDIPLDQKRKEKISIFCNIKPDHVISSPDVESIYDVPINFEKDNLSDIVCKALRIKPKNEKADLGKWKELVAKSKNGKKEVNIAVVGKYFDSGDYVLSDVYISVLEAVKYSGYKMNVKPKMHYINSKRIEDGSLNISELKKYDGILVPGGFGESGIEGIIRTIRFARENKIPYFGLCYGMQLAVIEFARNVAGLKNANTAEINPDAENVVIDIMPEQKKILSKGKYGGTMRLGSYVAVLRKGSIARKVYGRSYERS
jgi:CTP synthase